MTWMKGKITVMVRNPQYNNKWSYTHVPGLQHDFSARSGPEWCVCGRCQPMPQEIESKCYKLKNCVTHSAHFPKLYLDLDVLELSTRDTGDISNDREDNSTRAFRKSAYRQFILARHGHLGKGNRRACPSCVVLEIREKFPSVTGIYMGYRKH